MELGSEYNLDVSTLTVKKDNLYDYLSGIPFVEYYDSGRSALRQFASLLRSEDKILLPGVICESVIKCFVSQNLLFYRIRSDFSIDLEDLESQMDGKVRVIFLMHYFGAVQPPDTLKRLREIADRYGCVLLEDTTHSIFSARNTIGDYCICSLRKWMPLSGGGVLYILHDKIGLPQEKLSQSSDNERVVGFILKDMFLKNQLDCNEQYRAIFAACEARLDEQKACYRMSDCNRFLAECVSIQQLITRRRQNYSHLIHALQQLNTDLQPAVQIRGEECPFAMPIRVPDRDMFRSYLMANRIYCAVHWPEDDFAQSMRKQHIQNARELISLPVDQRYDETYMDYMVSVISKYGGDLVF